MASPSRSVEDFERWACVIKFEGKTATTHWTIVDGIMHARGSNSSFTVVENTKTLTVAYILHKTDDRKTTSTVKILDKTANVLVSLTDASAVIFAGKHGQPYEAEATRLPCRRE